MKKLGILLIIVAMSSCSDENAVTRNYAEQLEFDIKRIEGYLAENQLTGFQKTASGIHYKITQEGNGKLPVRNNVVAVEYVGRKLNNAIFDRTQPGAAPFSFILGVGQVIQGWDEGIALISEQGSATLIIPSGLAYGPQRVGSSIGANEVLVFDVTVLEVK